jgi:hypothetical protein
VKRPLCIGCGKPIQPPYDRHADFLYIDRNEKDVWLHRKKACHDKYDPELPEEK